MTEYFSEMAVYVASRCLFKF